MKTTKREPQQTTAPQPLGAAYGQWLMANVRREMTAGRVRTTVDEAGEQHTIN